MQGPCPGRAVSRNMFGSQTLNNLPAWLMVAIMPAHRYQCVLRVYRFQEGRRVRSTAAMVWQNQYIGVQDLRMPLDQFPFAASLYVAGQQHRMRAGRDAQHTGGVIRILEVITGIRVQKRELNAIPAPSSTRDAGLAAHGSPAMANRHGRQDGGQSATVIAIRVADDNLVQVIHMPRTKVRQNDAPACIIAKASRPGIKQQRVVPGADERG